MTTHTNPSVFQAILSPEPAWRSVGFAWSALALVVVCSVLLLGALQQRSSPREAPTPAPRTDLVVTLLDIPAPPTAAVAPPEPAQEPGGHAPAAQSAKVTAPVLKPKAQLGKLPLAAAAASHVAVEPAHPAEPAPPAAAAVALSTPAAVPASAAASSVGTAEPAHAAGAGESRTARGSGSGSGTGTGTGSGSGSAAGTTQVMPFMDGMTRPKLLNMVAPEYTREARDANVTGLFLAKCVITTAGALQQCRVVKGLPMMDQAVLSALARWRYSPVVYQGKPVAVDYVIQVRLAGP